MLQLNSPYMNDICQAKKQAWQHQQRILFFKILNDPQFARFHDVLNIF
jgi:hypothetical protein